MITLFAMFSSALIFMAICFGFLQVKRWGKYWPIAYVCAAVALVLPINNWIMIEFVRGFFSDISITTLFLIVCYLYNTIKPNSIQVQPSLKWFVLALGVFMFPMSMGATMFDPFAMGYTANPAYNYLVVTLAVIALIAWFFSHTHLALVIAFALVANGVGLLESENLWSYLIDPVAVIICLFSLLVQGIKKAFKCLRFKMVEN